MPLRGLAGATKRARREPFAASIPPSDYFQAIINIQFPMIVISNRTHNANIPNPALKSCHDFARSIFASLDCLVGCLNDGISLDAGGERLHPGRVSASNPGACPCASFYLESKGVSRLHPRQSWYSLFPISEISNPTSANLKNAGKDSAGKAECVKDFEATLA